MRIERLLLKQCDYQYCLFIFIHYVYKIRIILGYHGLLEALPNNVVTLCYESNIQRHVNCVLRIYCLQSPWYNAQPHYAILIVFTIYCRQQPLNKIAGSTATRDERPFVTQWIVYTG